MTEPFVLTAEDFKDCIDTPERAQSELAALEAQLAVKFKLQGDIHAEVLKLYHDGTLDDGGLGSDWMFTYYRCQLFEEESAES